MPKFIPSYLGKSTDNVTLSGEDGANLDIRSGGALGSAAFTNIDSEWTLYTPAPTSSTGTITSFAYSVGGYRRSGKTIFFRLDFGVSNNGTGSGSIHATLPFTSVSGIQYTASGENYTNHKSVNGFISSSANYISIYLHDGSYPIATGEAINMCGFYEVP